MYTHNLFVYLMTKTQLVKLWRFLLINHRQYIISKWLFWFSLREMWTAKPTVLIPRSELHVISPFTNSTHLVKGAVDKEKQNYPVVVVPTHSKNEHDSKNCFACNCLSVITCRSEQTPKRWAWAVKGKICIRCQIAAKTSTGSYQLRKSKDDWTLAVMTT